MRGGDLGGPRVIRLCDQTGLFRIACRDEWVMMAVLINAVISVSVATIVLQKNLMKVSKIGNKLCSNLFVVNCIHVSIYSPIL